MQATSPRRSTNAETPGDAAAGPAFPFSQRAGWARGQPISALMSQALANPELISLAAGFVDQATLPADETGAVLEELFADPQAARAALQYGTTIGYGPLREEVLGRLRELDAAVTGYGNVSVENTLITAGSNQLLQLVGETILDPGDIVLCAAPSYFVFLGLLANQGARSRGVETDEHGIMPDALEEELSRLDAAGELPRVKAIYCVSYFDNPCGVSISPDRRPAIVEIARKWSRRGRILVIEDAAYRLLRYTGQDVPSMRAYDEDGDTVLLAGTFSKSFSPGIRVGWGLLPKDLIGPVCEQKGNFDFGSPNFAQHLMHRLLATGRFDQHVEMLRQSYHRKLNAMLDAAKANFASLDGVSWIVPEGGLYVWMKLPEGVFAGPDHELFARAKQAGVLYVPGQYCYPAEGNRFFNRIRLSFGVQSEENIRHGMKALAEALRNVIASA